MENIDNKLQNTVNTQKEQEIVWAHAKQIVEMGIANNREVNKWMDALCMDEEICKKILWEDVYIFSKDSLAIKKPFLDISNDKEILSLPEFQSFLEQYTLNKQKQKEALLREEEIDKRKWLLKNIDLPESIKEEKNYLDDIKMTIRDILSEKDEKMLGMNKTFLDVSKIYILNKEERTQKLNKIYDFVFNYLESSSVKKKYRSNESSLDFYLRIWIDYTIDKIRNIIQETEKKLQIKIKKRKDSQWEQLDKVNKKGIVEIDVVDYKQEALQLFIDHIDNNESIKSRFYLPEDKKQIEIIQSYFTKNIDESISSPSMEMIVKDWWVQRNSLEKIDDKIKMNTHDYLEIEWRKHNFKNFFLNKNKEKRRTPRVYLFDRLIEYMGKNILEYEIQEAINTTEKYKWTTFDIYNTDNLDDSFAYADYAILYKFKNETKRRIALIDLFVSDKESKEDVADINGNIKIESWSYAAKLEKAKKAKIPYSFYCWLFNDNNQASYKMKPLTRYVEKQEPSLVYHLLRDMIKSWNVNIKTILSSNLKKDDIFSLISNKNKKNIKNILQEIDKNAA